MTRTYLEDEEAGPAHAAADDHGDAVEPFGAALARRRAGGRRRGVVVGAAAGPRERHDGAVVEDHEHSAGDGADGAEDLGLAVEAPQPDLLHPEDERHEEGDRREDVDEGGGEARGGQLRAQVVHVLVQHGLQQRETHDLGEDERRHLGPHSPATLRQRINISRISTELPLSCMIRVAVMVHGTTVPLEEEREWGHDGGADDVAVDDEDEVAHAAAEGGDGDDVHAGEPHHEEHHVQVGLHLVQDLAHAHG